MAPAAISIIQHSLFALAGLAIAMGLLLVLMDVGSAESQVRKGGRSFSKQLSAFWSRLSEVSWPGLLGCYARLWGEGVARFTNYWFGGSDRNSISGGLFIFMVLIGIPAAAAFNALRGGSAFLITVIAVLALSALVLAVLTETRTAGHIRAALAVGFFAGAFVFVPAYTLVSFTDRIIHIPVGHAAIGSIILLPLLYIPCHSLAVGANAVLGPEFGAGRRIAWLAKLVTTYFAMLPAAYLLVFGGLVFGHIAVPSDIVPLDWQTLLLGTGFTALALAVTYILLVTPAGSSRTLGNWFLVFLGVTVVSMMGMAADGQPLTLLTGVGLDGTLSLGPKFWVHHAGYSLLGITILGAVNSNLMKAYTAVLPNGIAIRHSLAVTGGYAIVIGAAVGSLATVLS